MTFDNLPLGPLSFKDLGWSTKTFYNKTFLAAKLPKSRLQDFVEGEGIAAGISFSSRNSHPQKKEIKARS